MVRFRSSSETDRPPPNYFSRGVQYRLLALVFSLLLVLFLAGHAAKPSTWSWMFASTQAKRTSSQVEGGRDLPAEDTIDTRLNERPQQTLAPDVMTISEAPTSNLQSGNPSSLFDIDPQRFDIVKDNTVSRSAEFSLWHQILASLRDAETVEIDDTNAVSVGFTQLYKQPEAYRGQWVSLHGTVRRAHRLVAQDNEFGIESYVRCWLFPEGSTNPIVVYAVEMPTDFPQGMAIREAVHFRGIFFKRWAYEAAGGVMTAPMVLAKTGVWKPAPTVRSPARTPKLETTFLSGLGLAVLATTIAWLAYHQSQSTKPQTETCVQHADQDASQLRAAFEQLGKMEFETPAQAMQRSSSDA